MGNRTCPKCGLAQPETNTECVQCGIVFERYHAQRDALLKKTSARKGPPPREPLRVRPLTYLLLLAFFLVSYLAIRELDVVRNPPSAWSGDQGISAGGNIEVKPRGRVEVAGPTQGEWDGELCFGVRVFPDAAPVATDGASPQTEQKTYLASAPLDDVHVYYEELYGPARVFTDSLVVPDDHPSAATLRLETIRWCRWYARTTGLDGTAQNIDIDVRSPYLAIDGTFHPDSTAIVCGPAG
jgi:hypothetical protein